MTSRPAHPFVYRAGDASPFEDLALVVELDSGIESLDELFERLAAALHFPSYFGRNWDALRGLLRDLSWLVPRKVVILHTELPRLADDDTHTYLDILRSSIETWIERGGPHELVVGFPLSEQLRVYRMLAARA